MVGLSSFVPNWMPENDPFTLLSRYQTPLEGLKTEMAAAPAQSGVAVLEEEIDESPEDLGPHGEDADV